MLSLPCHNIFACFQLTAMEGEVWTHEHMKLAVTIFG